MNLSKLKTIMPALLSSGVSIELISPPGIGKSDFVSQTVEHMGAADKEPWGFATLFLATQTPPDLLGYMFKGQLETKAGPISITDPTLPPWMVTREGKPVWEYQRGVLFLDEFGQGQADVKAAAAELLLNKRLGKWALPEGWTVVAASNRAKDRSAVTKSLDFVINRRVEINIEFDLAAWEEWAWAAGVDPLFISFAAANPMVINPDGVPDKQGPWCTPRSLVLTSRMLQQMSDGEDKIPVDATAVEVAKGMIGEGAAATLMTHVRLGHEMPDFDEIVKSPKKAKAPSKPDACLLVAYNLAARVEEKNITPVIEYIERMPKEFSVTFAKAAIKRKPALINTDAVQDWSNRNASLMTAISDNKK